MEAVGSIYSLTTHGLHEQINPYSSGQVLFHMASFGEDPNLLCFSHQGSPVQQLKTELHNTSKGSTPISKYLLQIKALVNSPISIGCSVSESEHIKVIFDGLSTKNDAFVTSITTRVEQ